MKNPLEDVIFSINGYFVTKEITENDIPVYHVFIKGITHAICDSAYYDVDCAISRCKYLEKNKL